MKDCNDDSIVNLEEGESTQPFILDFLEEREGAVSPTTSGTYDNCDGADCS